MEKMQKDKAPAVPYNYSYLFPPSKEKRKRAIRILKSIRIGNDSEETN